MKKLKELLLFIIPFVVLTVCGFVSLFSDIIGAVDVLNTQLKFMDNMNFIRLFINDDTFKTALFNTYYKAVIPSFILVAVFALTVFLIREKVRIPRLGFYLGCVFLGSAVSIAYTAYIKIKVFGVPSSVYNAQTIISSQPPSVLESVTLTSVLFALQIGIFTAFIFWLGEMIYNRIKSEK